MSKVQHGNAENDYWFKLVPCESKGIIAEDPEHLLKTPKETLDACSVKI